MEQNVLNNVIQELGEALAPLRSVNTGSQVTAFFKKLGYELPIGSSFGQAPGALISKATAVVDGVTHIFEQTDDEAKLQAVIELIPKIAELVEQINQFAQNMQNAAAAPPAFFSNSQISELPRRLLDYLISIHIEKRYPGAYTVCSLIGLFDEIPKEANAAIFQPVYVERRIWWERVPLFLTRPGEIADTVYAWNDNFNATVFLTKLDKLLRLATVPGGLYNESPSIRAALDNTEANIKEIWMPLFQGGDTFEQYSQFGLILTQLDARPAESKKKGLALLPYFKGSSSLPFSLNEHFQIIFNATVNIDDGFGILLRPPFNLDALDRVFSTPGDVGEGSIRLTLRKRTNPDQEFIVFGERNGSRFALKGFETGIFALKKHADADLGFEFGINEAKIVIGTGQADGFLSTVLSGVRVEATFSLGVGITVKGGVTFRGGLALEIPVPAHIQLGPVEIRGLTIGIRPQFEGTPAIPITATSTLGLTLGPFAAVVENMGLAANFRFPEGGGNMGPADFSLDFKPPNGIGLSLDTPVVRGAGYILFDPENEQYAGAIELSIQGMIQVSAICVITTKFPDGTKGFSLLLIVSATFTPGIVLGMGFFLSGLGGMIGINRTINTEALRAGVRTGAIDNILFPENIIPNITRIISDIRTIFPAKQDQFMIGFMARITWGVPSLVIIDFGICVEFANPVRIAILGVLKIALPTEEAAIVLVKVSFVGIIDFEKGELSFDASLFGSRILTFTLQGDMAVRLSWGAEKNFILSIGGFHPAFSPPAGLTNMQRLGIVILPDNPRLALTTYFAVTSNTVQFGAKIELRASAAGFSIVGELGFDVLFQFSPFKFIARIYAMVEIKAGSMTLLSIKLDLQLEGPTPWIASGTGSFSILFFEISVSFRVQWGEERHDALPDIQVLPRLMQALTEDKNWSTETPNNRFDLISLRELKAPTGMLILQSFGALLVRQNILPLDIDINKFGENNPQDIKRAIISTVKISDEVVPTDDLRDAFAPANFRTMKDEDKLKAPSYSPEKSGIRVRETNEIKANYHINRPVEYEVITSDFDPDFDNRPRVLFELMIGERIKFNAEWFSALALNGAIGQSALSLENKVKKLKDESPQGVKLGSPVYQVVDTATLTAVGHAAFTGGTMAQADSVLADMLVSQPEFSGRYKVMNLAEIF